jgi:hypothetical protein
MDLCTLQELKDFMGIADTSKDSILTLYISGVSQAIQKKIGRNIFNKDYIERYRGTNTAQLVLNNYPVNTVDMVEYVYENEVYRTLDDYEYDLNQDGGFLTKDDGWLIEGYSLGYMSNKIDFPRRHIRVTYNAGYTDVPFDLKLLCMQYISDLYILDTKKKPELKSYKIDDISYEYNSEIKFSEDQLKIIKSYKDVRF